MDNTHALSENFIHTLNKHFFTCYPSDVARKLELLAPSTIAQILEQYSIKTMMPVWNQLTPGVTDTVLLHLSKPLQKEVLSQMDPTEAAILMSRLDDSLQASLLKLLDHSVRSELQELLSYPENTAGRLMSTRIMVIHKDVSVSQAIKQLKRKNSYSLYYIFLNDDESKVVGQVSMDRILMAHDQQLLSELSEPVCFRVSPFEHKEDLLQKIENDDVKFFAVIDENDHILGTLSRSELLLSVKQDLATDMQTMVGASKDERALSSSVFTIKKRLPWLEINLLTAFLAAAVVGLFENTIAEFTALAILLPIAAGQSGNAGAQALAVTMRGLSLREITLRHWLKVTFKECLAGLVNGSVIGITCAIGIYFWSHNVGLSLVICLAMVISMTLAGISGAIVPILLKRFGLDPAQSSSIVLTTVTDIVGFMSFLGLATIFAKLLRG